MCFSLAFVENLLIWLVVICCIVACVRVLVPWICGKFGVGIPAEVIVILGYILWAVVLIFAIVVIFDLLACVVSGGGLHFSLLPNRG